MNAQIQTLIDECTTVSDDLVYDGENSYMETHEYFDKEKFAELIVRECSQVVKDCEQYGCSKPLEFELLEHFGVEE